MLWWPLLVMLLLGDGDDGVQVDLSGLTVNLLEASSEGSWEVAALTVDRLYLYKEGGRDRADFCIHHLQVSRHQPTRQQQQHCPRVGIVKAGALMKRRHALSSSASCRWMT